MTLAGWVDRGDRVLAGSIFGTDDPGSVRRMILGWATGQGIAGARVDAVAFSVGAAVTLRLPDGSRLFVKVWPQSTDVRGLAAQMRVQQGMATSGFPAPRVLTGLSALEPGRPSGWAVAMTHDRSGRVPDARRPAVRRMMAAGLAGFVAQAEAWRGQPDLPGRELPLGDAVWPRPHNALFDFAATARGAGWIDRAGAVALAAIRAAASRLVVGHHDWSAKNMRIGEHRLAVLYDWDAVFLDRETSVVGSAAAHFPITGAVDAPEPGRAEIVAFVREYEQARFNAFSRAELAGIGAAASYSLAWEARCEHAIDPGRLNWTGSARESLLAHGPIRLLSGPGAETA